MKKLIIFVFVFVFLFFSNKLCTFALDFDYMEGHENITGNVGLSFLFPIDANSSVGVNILGSLLLSSVSFGFGYHWNIIPHIFSPGIGGDFHISLLNLLFQNDRDDDFYKDKEKENDFYFFQLGIRIYNKFWFGEFDIQPFFGLNLILLEGDCNPTGLRKVLGILMAYEEIGLEYSYQWPLFDKMNNGNYAIHRIVFVYHM